MKVIDRLNYLEQREHAEAELYSLYFYKKAKRSAFCFKAITQMLIGFLIFVVLIAKAIFKLDLYFNEGAIYGWNRFEMNHFLQKPTLDLVGQGLALSAGIELAYMLFTPGPDEAIEPVILGLAASTLIIASDGKSDIKDYIVIPIYIITIGILFLYKKNFIDNRLSQAKSK